jgi:hypothetical protein
MLPLRAARRHEAFVRRQKLLWHKSARSAGRAREGIKMASAPWDAQGEARDALRAIMADPRYGPGALSNAQTMTNLLKDMLPDAPRESSVLVAASEAGVIGILQTHMSNGMDLTTASRLAAGSFESQTALTPEACHWAVGALASALRLDAVRPAPPPPAPPPPVPPPAPVQGAPVQGTAPPASNGQPTMMAPATGTAVTPEREAPVKPGGLRIAAAAAVAVAVILLVWSCALTFLTSGGNNASFFTVASDSHGTWWNAIGPVAVAVLGIAAAVVLLASRAERTRGLAAGLLIGSGFTIILYYAITSAVTNEIGAHPGPAEIVGIIGGLLLLIAGVLAIIGPKGEARAAIRHSGSLSG